MDQLDWKTWTAIWGAITGTIGLSLQLFSKRPRFSWAPGKGEDRLRLVIYNPSSSPLMITRIFSRPRGPGFFPARYDHTALDVVRDTVTEMRTGRVPVLLRPTETREVTVNTIKAGTRTFVFVMWHRFWLFPIRVPVVLWLSREIADQVNHGGR